MRVRFLPPQLRASPASVQYCDGSGYASGTDMVTIIQRSGFEVVNLATRVRIPLVTLGPGNRGHIFASFVVPQRPSVFSPQAGIISVAPNQTTS